MRWLWLVAAVGCFLVPFVTHSVGLAALSLLAALVFLVVGVLSLASSRIESRTRDVSSLLSPEAVRLMREQAERRKREQTDVDSVSASDE